MVVKTFPPDFDFTDLSPHLEACHEQQLCPELRADHAVDDEVGGAVDHREQPRHGVEQELVGGREVVSPDLVAPQDCRYPRSRYADNSRYTMFRYLPREFEYAHHESGQIAHDEDEHYRVANSGSGELSCSAANILMKDYLNITDHTQRW